ncbi:MAG: UDP-N-acetylmuramoyl-tripeptide--D-alanyl-D-alanine ligase [Actinomycetota bacterium]
MIDTAVAAALVIVAVVDGLRWLRVAQREHYLSGSVTRFALRWRWVAIGLGVRGRTSKLAWTRRLRVLAVVALFIHVGIILAMSAFGLPWSGAALFALLLVPVTVDAALLATAPVERRLGGRFVRRAAAKLRTVKPTVVAITGSYGKTSTKVVLAHLVSGTHSVAASPASFNNRAGLARAVNEGLPAGTDVFVAEMGTYGPGEIAELCSWCPPDIAVMTAIGPVHLERFKNEANIVKAKSEIFARARTLVVNFDDPWLVPVADATTGKKIVRASATRSDVDAAVIAGDVYVRGALVGHVDSLTTAPSNVACAIAAAVELGVSPEDIVRRLATAPGAAHRLEASTAPSGVCVLDDTFNSNPAGARRGLALLKSSGSPTGRKVLITPGMIELGPRQRAENESFAADAAAVVSVIGIVGETNEAALAAGAARTSAAIERFRTREEAVAWVRANLGPGDAVLYENDLPDHYQ